jgi:hypothetical protein
MPGVSREHQFGSFRTGIEPERLFAFGVHEELDRRLEVLKAFFLGIALSICAGNFQTRSPKAAFLRLAMMHDSREFLHAANLTLRGLKEKQFIW